MTLFKNFACIKFRELTFLEVFARFIFAEKTKIGENTKINLAKINPIKSTL